MVLLSVIVAILITAFLHDRPIEFVAHPVLHKIVYLYRSFHRCHPF